MKLLWELFFSFFQIGLFSIGGGYAAIPLIQNQIVDIHGWLTLNEFSDLVTIAEMTPGAIALNASTFVGTRIAGFPGAILATAGCVAPALIIVSALAWMYYRFRSISVIKDVLQSLRPAVVAMIASAGLSILILSLWDGKGFSTNIGDLNVLSLLLFVGAFVVLRKWKTNPILTMLVCGVIGTLYYNLF